MLFSSLWVAEPLMGSLSPGKPGSLASAFHCKINCAGNCKLKGRFSSLCTQVGKRNSSRQPWKGGRLGEQLQAQQEPGKSDPIHAEHGVGCQLQLLTQLTRNSKDARFLLPGLAGDLSKYR